MPCAQHEAALIQAEAMLEEDAVKFDAFLKANDEKVQAAVRKADTETKARQEKVRALFLHRLPDQASDGCS